MQLHCNISTLAVACLNLKEVGENKQCSVYQKINEMDFKWVWTFPENEF